MLWKPNPSDWLSWRRTLDSHGFSPLKQVNRNNVNQLKMVWTRPIGTGNQESTPLAYNGMLFIPNSGDHIMAVDAKSGDMLWEVRRKLTGRGANNRNMAIWGTTLIDGSSDNFMYAIDARTGAPVWETPILDPKASASMSSHMSTPQTARITMRFGASWRSRRSRRTSSPRSSWSNTVAPPTTTAFSSASSTSVCTPARRDW